MSGARISFTCDTADDADVIAWCDSFGNRERGFGIKAAIRHYMDTERMGTEHGSQEPETDRLSAIEEQLSNVLHEIIELKRQGLAISINNDIINNDLQNSTKVDPAVESNIDSLFDDD